MSPIHPDDRRRACRVRPAAAGGFAIVTAIFLIVVLSAMGTYMLRFSTVQQVTALEDLQGAMAYQAARAGTEWAAYQIEQVPDAGGFAETCKSGATSMDLTTLAGGLRGFHVVVGCTASQQYTEGANSLRIYQIEAHAMTSATAAGQIGYVERRIDTSIEH